MSDQPSPDLLDIAGVAHFLGISRGAAYAYVRRNHVRNRSLDRRFRCYASDLVRPDEPPRPSSIDEWRERGRLVAVGK